MIDKKKYIEICNCCDFLLKDINSSIQTVSISWLHIIREHPIVLNRYEKLFTYQNAMQKMKSWIALFVNYFRILNCLLRSINNKTNIVELGNFESTSQIDYLFVSHLINEEQINSELDFYFADVISNLDSENYKTVTLLLNQTNISNSNLKKKYILKKRKILLSKILNFKYEISFFFKLIKERKLLNSKLQHFKTKSLQFNVIKEAKRQCLSKSTFDNFRNYYHFKEVIAKYNPRNIVTTFEGHAWERMLFAAAKQHTLPIKCMAYHHTSLFRYQHSVLQKLNFPFNPDIILTTGQASKERFENSELGHERRIEILGSSRAKDVLLCESNINKFKNSCIVIPEGIDSECIMLFRFSILCSKQAPNVNFIFKLHPIMSREVFVKKYPEFSYLPSNVKWASDNSKSYFSESKWVLYRGTTMIVQACYAGLIPFYYQSHPEEMTIDLLHEVSNYKITLRNVNDFLTSISSIKNINFDRDKVMNYCASLYSRFDHNILIRELNY